MKPRRTSAAEALGVPPVRVVIVTLDSHLASATERAQHLLLRELPGLRLSLHAAAEWADDPSALDRCKADIAQGDIIVVTMMFMEDHIQAVLPALRARRDQCDAMIACMSEAEVVKLTRVGRFDMGAPQTGMMALLKRLRGAKSSDKGKPGSAGAQQMKMLRRHAEDPALHPRHGAGCARLFPDAAVLARRFRRQRREHGPLPGRPLCRRRTLAAARHAEGAAAGRLPGSRCLPPTH